MDCPCGTGRLFAGCCGPILLGASPAPTAEALMRSRYSAYATGDVAHLERSWAPETRPAQISLDPAQRWIELEVVETERGRQLDAEGIVSFRAHYELHGQRGVRQERSRFRREAGLWVYVDGV